MPKIFGIFVFLCLLFCFGPDTLGGDSGVIRATATVVPAIGFEREPILKSNTTGFIELIPAIRLAENMGMVCNIRYGGDEDLSLRFDGHSNDRGTRENKVISSATSFDLTALITKLHPGPDTCIVTLIYSEN
ncbi:hypothetical protein TRIP_C21013 [Candidatus Zixiibacteriota bacterium]|nr:hypothetical protein TRIP_C21013 [candidate division Zixibacteria bacterium]